MFSTIGVIALLAPLMPAGFHPEAEALTGKGDPGQGARFGIVESSNMMLLSHLDIGELDPFFGSFSANDCWGYVTPQGKEIAIIGLRAATAFVDITDPYQPEILATYQGPESLWRDIKILDDYAYSVSEGGGYIQVFNLSQADAGLIIDRGSTDLFGTSTTHNIAIDEDSGYLYRLGAGATLQAYSVGARGLTGSPTQPDQTLIDPGFYVHDAQIVTYDSGPYAGRQIGFLCTGRGPVRIWDLTDKNNPFEISNVTYLTRRYAHQGWLDEERRYFYLNDELERLGDGTKMHIFDVQDLENPRYVGAFSNGMTSAAHNLYVKGNRVFASNYRSGLRVHDISSRENPVEIAWIDTYPQDDARGFDGAWSNYPYFPSGNIIVSDVQSGLFVARLEADSVVVQPAGDVAEVWDPAGGTPIAFRVAAGDTTIDTDSIELVLVDANGTETRVPGVIDDGLVEFDTPAFACGQEIDWWVQLQTDDEQAFGFPTPNGVNPASAVIADRLPPVFADDAESDPGWTTGGTATDGGWTRGVPVNAGRGDPATDADGSGSAWLTDNSSSNGGNSDVDNGTVTLTSPMLGPLTNGSLAFSYWLSDTDAAPLGPGDGLTVSIDTFDGAGFRPVRTYTNADGVWRTERLMPGVDLPDAAAFRVRFEASDVNGENVVEAGIDSVSLSFVECAACTSPADTNGDGQLAPNDFNAWILAFNNRDPACDQNGDGDCRQNDFNAWILNYNAGCE
ncbi:MAG: choice-of-anchor B family protein [Planctomycetota bacterium]